MKNSNVNEEKSNINILESDDLSFSNDIFYKSDQSRKILNIETLEEQQTIKIASKELKK